MKYNIGIRLCQTAPRGTKYGCLSSISRFLVFIETHSQRWNNSNQGDDTQNQAGVVDSLQELGAFVGGEKLGTADNLRQFSIRHH